MATDVGVQYDGFLPDIIIMLTLSYNIGEPISSLEISSLQPKFPPERFDIFSPD